MVGRPSEGQQHREVAVGGDDHESAFTCVVEDGCVGGAEQTFAVDVGRLPSARQHRHDPR